MSKIQSPKSKVQSPRRADRKQESGVRSQEAVGRRRTALVKIERPKSNAQNPTPRTPTNRNPKSAIQDPQSGERLQKVLAHAGVASRRAAEEMIAAGRVSVNGEIVREMGVRVLPTDVIQVEGKRLDVPGPEKQAQEHVYIVVNKPLGVVSTAKDPQGRSTVLDLLNPKAGISRVYPIGRLDVDSTGLLLLTNDGDLTFRVTHPRYGLEKEYRALVRGRPGAESIRRLREGVEIESGLTSPAKVEHLSTVEGNTWLRITIHEGRKRQVRLMTAAVGHPVIELQRTRVGPILLGTLEPGKWRYLALHEVHALRKAVGLHASTYRSTAARRS
jgi:23S rRNA pseudouridine2605 synthase